MIDSPFRDKTWEFLVTPIILLVAGLMKLLVWTSPVGYEIVFSIRALSIEEFEEYEDDWDDYS